MKRWLIAEAALLTLVPAGLTVYALPVLMFATCEALFPIGTDTRTLPVRVFELLPYLGGILGIFTAWRYTYDVASNRRLTLGWLFILAALGGGLATWEIVRSTNILTALLVCLPVWLLIIHLLILNHRFAQTLRRK